MALLDFFINAKGVNPFLVETNTSNPDVFKCYKGAVDSELLDLGELDGWLELLNRFSEPTQKESRVLVVNSAARNNTAVTRFGERLAMGLDELKIGLVTMWLISEQRDSLKLLCRRSQRPEPHSQRPLDDYPAHETQRSTDKTRGVQSTRTCYRTSEIKWQLMQAGAD